MTIWSTAVAGERNFRFAEINNFEVSSPSDGDEVQPIALNTQIVYFGKARARWHTSCSYPGKLRMERR